MKFEVERRAVEIKEIEVTFPLYLSSGDVMDNGYSYDRLLRIEKDGSVTELYKRIPLRGNPTYEFDEQIINLRKELVEYLDEGVICKREDFDKLFNELSEKLRSLRRPRKVLPQ